MDKLTEGMKAAELSQRRLISPFVALTKIYLSLFLPVSLSHSFILAPVSVLIRLFWLLIGRICTKIIETALIIHARFNKSRK